jgi:hypothetical protein
LTETIGNLMRGDDYHVAGNVRGEQSAKGEKPDDIDCAGGSTQNSGQ